MRFPLPCVVFLWLPLASSCASSAKCPADVDVLADDVHISLLQKSFSVASGNERTDIAVATDEAGPKDADKAAAKDEKDVKDETDKTKGGRPKEAKTKKPKNKLGPEYTLNAKLPTWVWVLLGLGFCSFIAMLYFGASWYLASQANRLFGDKREEVAPPEEGEATLAQMCMAEAAGTFLNVLGGCSVGSADKYLHCGLGLLGQAMAWGTSVALSIFASREVLGAAMASSLIYALFSGGIEALELELKLPRGTSTATFAGAFGLVPGPPWLTPLGAFLVEFVASTFLIFIVFTVTDWEGPVTKNAQPILIGTAVALMIAAFGALDGAGMNPARDSGPRIVTYFAGWGGISFSFWWCYTLGPICGGITGGWLYNRFFKNLSHN